MLLECTLIITLIFQFRKIVLSEKVPKLFALSVKYKAENLVLAQVACLLAALVCTNHPPADTAPKPFALSVKYKAENLVLAQVACLLAALIYTSLLLQAQYQNRSRCRLSTRQKTSFSRRSLAFWLRSFAQTTRPQTQHQSRSRCRLSTRQKTSCSRRSLAFWLRSFTQASCCRHSTKTVRVVG